MLLNMIGEDKKEKFTLMEKVFQKLTFYINPEMYMNEEQIKKTGHLPGQSINMEFKRHSESARKYGKPDLSPMMRQALDNIYNKDRKRENVLVLMGKEAVPTNLPTPTAVNSVPVKTDDNEPFVG